MTLTNEQDPKKELKPNTWEVFAKCYALENRTQYESYCIAYPKQAKNSTKKTINDNAFKLMQNTEILQRIDYLRNSLTEDIKDKLVYTAKQSFDNLIDIQNRAKEKEVFKDELKAEELKGKIAGLYEEVHKFKGDKDAPLKTEIIVKFVTKKET